MVFYLIDLKCGLNENKQAGDFCYGNCKIQVLEY